MAAGYLMGWEWPLGPRAILRPSLPWSASAPGQATGPASREGWRPHAKASCLWSRLAGRASQGGNIEALGLPALCFSPLLPLRFI